MFLQHTLGQRDTFMKSFRSRFGASPALRPQWFRSESASADSRRCCQPRGVHSTATSRACFKDIRRHSQHHRDLSAGTPPWPPTTATASTTSTAQTTDKKPRPWHSPAVAGTSGRIPSSVGRRLPHFASARRDAATIDLCAERGTMPATSTTTSARESAVYVRCKVVPHHHCAYGLNGRNGVPPLEREHSATAPGQPAAGG